jgi:hypothetical protein
LVVAKDLKQGDSLFAYSGYKAALDSIYTFRTNTATAVYNLEADGNHNYYVSASGVLVHNKDGGLNLFKWNAEQTAKSVGWKSGDRMLKMYDKGSPKLNWKQNSGYLRQEMRSKKTIFDSYRKANGSFIPTNGFLNAERYLLKSRGWYYSPKSGAWMPPR